MLKATAPLYRESTRISRSRDVRILAACSIGSLVALSTLIVYPFGLFAIAIEGDAHWHAATATALIGPALLILIPAQPVVGWIVGRFENRLVAIWAMLALALAMILLATAPLLARQFQVILMLAVALGSLATPAVYSAMLTRTFERRRGLALGFTLSFAGLGVAILPLLASFIIERWNWRVAYGTFAGLAVLGAIAIFCLLPRRAGVGALLGSVMADADAKASPAEGTIAGDRTFWTMAAIFVLLAVAANSVPLHLPQILRERGANLHLAAASLGVMGITMIVGRPFVGYLLDVLPIRAVLAITLGGPLAGSIALLTSGGAASALLASIGFGLAIGGEFACLGYMVSRAYGTHRFGFVYGWLAMAVASGVALGPIGISILLRLGRGYAPPLLMVVAACILALGATLTLREDRFSARPST